MGSIERIKKMESILGECTGTVMQLQEALDRIMDTRDASFRMLKLATDILKDKI